MNFDRITACGECCEDCQKFKSGICNGCVESGGNCGEWAASGGCPMAKCAHERGVKFCGVCPDFPCPTLDRIKWRPDPIGELRELAEEYKKSLDALGLQK